MEIVVCIKQVPDASEVEIDEEKGILKREGVDSRMNLYDAYALEAAVRLKEVHGGRVRVISMGPPQAAAVIREAFALGADEGYLLSDRKFAGADTLATSYTLSQGILKMGKPDLIICGMQTTDGDTAQVGPALAEMLEIPHVSYVKKIESLTDNGIVVEVDMTDETARVEVETPCLLTVTKEVNQPRLPSLRKKFENKNKTITVWSANDLEGANTSWFGLDGSPTQVERIFPPVSDIRREIWSGDGVECGRLFYEKLKELKYL